MTTDLPLLRECRAEVARSLTAAPVTYHDGTIHKRIWDDCDSIMAVGEEYANNRFRTMQEDVAFSKYRIIDLQRHSTRVFNLLQDMPNSRKTRNCCEYMNLLRARRLTKQNIIMEAKKQKEFWDRLLALQSCLTPHPVVAVTAAP